MTPKILHTYRYTGTPWEILKGVVPEGFIIETLKKPTYECLLNQCADADYLLVSGRLSIDERILSASKQLKMIQRTGVGTEMLDLGAIKNHRIPVYVNVGVNARSVAEHTLTLILNSLKDIAHISEKVKQGVWAKQQTGVTCNELYGKSVGLVGLGAIGKLVAQFLQVMGAKVYYTDIHRQPKEVEQHLSIQFVPTFEELLPKVSILSFHCPLTNENIEMLNEERIKMMQDRSIVINTARGKLINEQALYKALLNGKLRFAALDVHYEEPISPTSPLVALDNVIMTPHIGGLSYEAFQTMMSSAINNIVLFHNGNESMITKKRIV